MGDARKQDRSERHALNTWSGEALADLFLEGGETESYWALSGVSAQQVQQVLPALSGVLTSRGHILFTLDPLGVHAPLRTFSDVIDAYVVEVTRRVGLSEKVEELIEWMHASTRNELSAHDREVVQTDTLSRLWVALNEAMPAVMVVFHPDRLASQTTHQIGYLVRYYFHDPIESLSPELGGERRGRGVLAVVSVAGETIEIEGGVVPREVDVTRHFEDEVRAYLTRPEVIRTLLETTRGDMGRLEELVTEFGANVHHLWLKKLERLEPGARQIVELLAATGDIVDMNLLHDALVQAGGGHGFGAQLKALVDQGFVQRVVQMGSVRVGLADLGLAEHLLEPFSGEQRQALHQALYRAALVGGEVDAAQTRFVAQHALKAGAIEVALEYGVRAARQMFGHGELEEATVLLDALLEHASSDVMRAELHAMSVDIWSRLGRWRHALRHCDELKHYVAGDRGRIELDLRTASLLVKLGHYETAAGILDESLERYDEGVVGCDVGARLATERGEAAFKLGDYQAAADAAQRAITILEEAEASGSIQAVALERSRMSARNLLGKVYIFQARHDEALEIFETNLALATAQRWPGESARAEGNLGVVAMQRFDYEEAITRLQRVLEFSQHSPIVSRSICLLNLAVIHHYRFEFEQAFKHTLEALRVSRQNEEDSVYSTCLGNLGLLYKDMGALDRGQEVLEALTDEHAPVRNNFISPHFRGMIAAIAYERQDFQQVVRILAPFVEESKHDTVINAGLAEVFRLAMAYCELGDFDEARALLGYTEVPEGREEPRVEVMRTIVEARLLERELKYEEAEQLLERAASLGRRTGIFADAIRADFLRIELAIKQEHIAQARYACEQLLDGVAHYATHVPERLRQGFMQLPLHQRLMQIARGLEVPFPPIFSRYGEVTGGSGEHEASEDRGPQWQAWRQRYSEIVGETPRLHQLFRIMDKVAVSDTPVLLLGESGTGKELFAEAIHKQSHRAKGPLIKVNCAAFVESLLMSELFGHEKGAFTGAVSQKIGRFEMADGGTIFLDEIADISPQTQVALLRVLQEKEIERVGGSGTTKVDVRVVCATNKDLEKMVQEGSFRLDLYYRLKGMVLELPALRERRDDIPRLAEAMAGRVGDYHFSRAVMERLVAYSWPGNIRELQNFVRSVLLFVDGHRVEMSHIAQFDDFFAGGEMSEDVSHIVEAWAEARHTTLQESSLGEESSQATDDGVEASLMTPGADPELVLVDQIVNQGKSLSDLKKRLEIECIRRALIETQGNVTRAAGLLQMKRPRLSQIINATEELSDLKTELMESG